MVRRGSAGPQAHFLEAVVDSADLISVMTATGGLHELLATQEAI